MATSPPSKPKRYYLPLSLSYDDAQTRWRRWQESLRQQKQQAATTLQYFDAELFKHTTVPSTSSAAPPVLQSFSRARNTQNSIPRKRLVRSKPITTSSCNRRVKQTESFTKQTTPQHLPVLPRSSTPISRTPPAQIFRKSYQERPVDVGSAGITSRIFSATKHISLLPRHGTLSCEGDLRRAETVARYRSMNTEFAPRASPERSSPTAVVEQRLKTTLISSAEKLRHVFHRSEKRVESPPLLKDDHFDVKTYPTKYSEDEDNGMSYI